MDLIWAFLLYSLICGHYISAENSTVLSITDVASPVVEASPFGTHSVVQSMTLSQIVGSSPVNNHSVIPSMTFSPVSNMSTVANGSSVFPTPSSPSANVSSHNMSSTHHVKPSMSLNTSSASSTHHVKPSMSLNTSSASSTHHFKPTMSLNASSASTVIPTFSPNVTISATSVMTSSVMPSSSVVPTPPSPPYGNYSVKNSNGSACVLASFSVKFEVVYTNETSGKQATAAFDLPMETNVVTDGSCPHDTSKRQESSISLSWPMLNPMYNFTVVFYTEKKKGIKGGEGPEDHWLTGRIEININTTDNNDFPNAKDLFCGNQCYTLTCQGRTLQVNLDYCSGVLKLQICTAQIVSVSKNGPIDFLRAKVGYALTCGKKISVKDLKNSNGTVSAKVTFDKLEIQPFEVPSSGKFGEADDCDHTAPPKPKSKKKSNVVGIAVGCTLGGLVLIVLIGYLIGRRRSRSNVSAGYRKL